MTKISKNIIVSFLILIAISRCIETSEPHVSPPTLSDSVNNIPGITMTTKDKIQDPNATLEIQQIPPITEFSNEQKEYVIELIDATMRVVNGTSTLDAEEKVTFGEGQFFWPKDPSAPVRLLKYFPLENFRMKGITLSFRRISETSPWTHAVLSASPINFPSGAYKMNLPREVFNDYQLMKAEVNFRADEPLHRVNVFHYRNKNNIKITMTIESPENVSTLKDDYPSSFHVIQIKKSG
jgi:hypothetical protein